MTSPSSLGSLLLMSYCLVSLYHFATQTLGAKSIFCLPPWGTLLWLIPLSPLSGKNNQANRQATFSKILTPLNQHHLASLFCTHVLWSPSWEQGYRSEKSGFISSWQGYPSFHGLWKAPCYPATHTYRVYCNSRKGLVASRRTVPWGLWHKSVRHMVTSMPQSRHLLRNLIRDTHPFHWNHTRYICLHPIEPRFSEDPEDTYPSLHAQRAQQELQLSVFNPLYMLVYFSYPWGCGVDQGAEKCPWARGHSIAY